MWKFNPPSFASRNRRAVCRCAGVILKRPCMICCWWKSMRGFLSLVSASGALRGSPCPCPVWLSISMTSEGQGESSRVPLKAARFCVHPGWSFLRTRRDIWVRRLVLGKSQTRFIDGWFLSLISVSGNA